MIETIAVLTPPAVPVVDLAAMKLHLRVEVDADDDLIASLVGAATALVEARVKGALVNRSLRWTLDAWTDRAAAGLVNPTSAGWVAGFGVLGGTSLLLATPPLILPQAPLVSVEAVAYVAPDGTTRTLDPATYLVLPGRPGRLALRPGRSWPTLAAQPGSVAITFTAGYGPTGASVPANLGAAIKLLVGHWYRNREAATTAAMIEIPLGVERLINASKGGFYA